MGYLAFQPNLKLLTGMLASSFISLQLPSCHAFLFARRNPNPQSWAKFKEQRKVLKKEIVIAKKKHFGDLFDNVHTSADFWKAVHKCSNEVHSPLPSLQRKDGSFAVTDEEKAELISETFASAFNKNDIAPSTFSDNLPTDAEWICKPEFVFEEILRMATTIPSGPDLIPVKLLKACAGELADPVAALLNKCLKEGEFPDLWKQAQITAIPKKADASTPDGLRPISILPVMSKITERWLLKLLKPFLRLSPNQFAFQPGKRRMHSPFCSTQ